MHLPTAPWLPEYYISWAAVVLCAIVLAASETGSPREAYMLKAALPASSNPMKSNTVCAGTSSSHATAGESA